MFVSGEKLFLAAALKTKAEKVKNPQGDMFCYISAIIQLLFTLLSCLSNKKIFLL